MKGVSVSAGAPFVVVVVVLPARHNVKGVLCSCL